MSDRTPLLPENRVSIEFRGLTYKISNEKVILKNINGCFEAGELTAIIGPSGSGKTTLINILAGYKCQDYLGTVLINGRSKRTQNFMKLSRYILQECELSNQLSVKETMEITAKLKLSNSSLNDRRKIIDEILKKLNFECDVRTPVDKLSTGERKRLVIGLELINDFSILFLDEPTTGLDYFSCSKCINLLRDLASNGRTVICSLHTPTAQMLSIFDKVYVITEGRCAYQGKSEDIVPHLANLNLICPPHYDPVDFITELCNGDYGDYQDSLISSVDNGKITVNKILSKDCNANYNINSSDEFKYGATWIDQFFILYARMWLQAWKNKKLIFSKFFCLILITLSLGLLYLNKGQDGTYSFKIYLSFFFSTQFYVFFWGIPAVAQFTEEYKSFKREYFNGWYSLSAFYCAFSLSVIHFHVFYGIIFVTLLHGLIDFPTEFNTIFIALVIWILTSLVTESLAHLVAILFTKLMLSLFGYVLILLWFFMLVLEEGRYLYPRPIWHFIAVQFNFVWFTFKGITSIILDNKKRLNCSEFCLFSDTNKIIRSFGTGPLSWKYAILALTIILILVRVSGFYLLKLKMSKRTIITKFKNRIINFIRK